MKNVKMLSLVIAGIFFGFQSMAQWIDWNYVPYRNGAKWGFSNAEKNVVIAPKYDEVGWFSQGLAPVRVGSKWGYVNTEGKLVIPVRYTVAKNFRKGYLPTAGSAAGDSILFAGVSLRADKYEVCIDAKGRQLRGCPAIPENSVAENRIPIKQVTTQKVYDLPNSGGLFDKIVDDYKVIGSNETYYVAMKGGKFGVFNAKFETVVPFDYSSIKVNRTLTNPYLEVTRNDLIGLSSPSGQVIMNPENTTLSILKGDDGKDYAIVQRGTRYYVRDLANNEIIPQGYQSISYDKNGFLLTNDQGLQGYYFLNNTRIEPKYKKVEWVDGGRFLRVTTSTGRVGYINTVGDEYFKE